MFNAMVKMDRQKEMKPDPEVADCERFFIDSMQTRELF